MTLRFIFLCTVFSSLLYGQNDDRIVSQRMKDSLVAEQLQDFYFRQGRWGFVYIKESFLAEQTEITIGEWLNYIYYSNLQKAPILAIWKNLSDKEKEQIKNTTIDSTLLPTEEFIKSGENKGFFKKCTDCDLLRIRSLDGFAYLPFDSNLIKTKKSRREMKNRLQSPITGISYEQAINFCKWRTTIDSLRWLPKVDPFTGKITDIYRNNCIYRLPTEAEFNKMNPQFDSIRNSETHLSHFNYKGAVYSNKKSEKNKIYGKQTINGYDHFLTKADRHSRLKYVWNIQGNVAEMTSQKGIAKGGSYFHYAKDSYNEYIQNYTKPELWLGFRCVALKGKIELFDPSNNNSQ